MSTTENTTITVSTTVPATVEKVWSCWTDPVHIIHWNYASDNWHTPLAENDVRVGGRLCWRMESKDGKQGFDFAGHYNKVILNRQLSYTLDDGRNVMIMFDSNGNDTTVTERFEAEQTNTVKMQQAGWQAILDHFKKYIETSFS